MIEWNTMEQEVLVLILSYMFCDLVQDTETSVIIIIPKKHENL